MKNNKGITLVEIIIATGLLFLIFPLAWGYVTSSFQDTATINNKTAVQGSVNALMTQLQRDIQEARCPINPNTSKYVNIQESDGFLICKPNLTDSEGRIEYASVLYKWNKDEKRITVIERIRLVPPEMGNNDYDVDLEVEGVTTGTYDYIADIKLTPVENNGIEVYIRGEIDEKAGYTLNNTYYTRNTVF